MKPGLKSIMKFGTTKLSKGEVMKNIGIFAICTLVCVSSYAALPPLSEEAQLAANLAKAKAAYGDNVAAYQLCQAQNRVADHYRVALALTVVEPVQVLLAERVVGLALCTSGGENKTTNKFGLGGFKLPVGTSGKIIKRLFSLIKSFIP